MYLFLLLVLFSSQHLHILERISQILFEGNVDLWKRPFLYHQQPPVSAGELIWARVVCLAKRGGMRNDHESSLMDGCFKL